MILEIQHETHLSYTEPVTESIAEVRMEPVSEAGQRCHSFHLSVTPSTGIFRYADGFGNRVHHFNVLPPHREMRVLAASIVETATRRVSLADSTARYPLDPSSQPLDLLEYLSLRGPVRHTARLDPILETLKPGEGQPLGQVIERVADYIHQKFQYARDVTLASSPIDDVLRHGKGVCQDFTHLMIAILRSFAIPARYVSGYIHREADGSQSHAWCEVWFPDLHWVGFDPTNDRITDDHFVKVATGRDFSDVPPNKGLFRGKATETIRVRVETRSLDSLPSLSWQEQLPALHLPLTEIVSGREALSFLADDEASQQQQQ